MSSLPDSLITTSPLVFSTSICIGSFGRSKASAFPKVTRVGSRSIPGKKMARIDPHVYDCWFEGGAPILGVKSEGHTDASPPVPSMRSVSRSALKQGDYGSPFGEPSATGGGEVASTGCLSRKRSVRVRAASSLDCCSLAPHLIGETFWRAVFEDAICRVPRKRNNSPWAV